MEENLSILPFAHRFVLRQEMLYASTFEMICNFSLVVCAGVSGVPAGLDVRRWVWCAVERPYMRRYCELLCHWATWQVYPWLRRVTYGAICDLTLYESVSYWTT